MHHQTLTSSTFLLVISNRLEFQPSIEKYLSFFYYSIDRLKRYLRIVVVSERLYMF